MPKRTDISSILIIGSGPIVIGQASEFDYSGTQACKVLKQEGYRVILANSNPATIMTDPDFADSTYIEPMNAQVLEDIIEKERPDALLPTLGGQTGLNLAMELWESGFLTKAGVELIGANAKAIETAENRDLFKQAMTEIGLLVPESDKAYSVEQAIEIVQKIGFPVMIRPSYILGGAGTAIAEDMEAFKRAVSLGIAASPVGEVLVEKSIAGWKEYELEVMRDQADNCVIICSIENFDAMGVHTGDSITVAPAQTLSDPEYQKMRDQAFACIRRIGVETGGSNVQFAINPKDGQMVIIEMNPRVSRSSALASKATGFPIAKIAARLAVGYRLDEIINDITKTTPASFEPTIDYVVTKIPRWAFEKLPGVKPILGTRMQSVGEVMAIGRNFAESLQKAIRSLEQGWSGLNCDFYEQVFNSTTVEELLKAISIPSPIRIFQIETALRKGASIEQVSKASEIDKWFLYQIDSIVNFRKNLETIGFANMDAHMWRRAKRLGFSDAQLGWLWGLDESIIRSTRIAQGVIPTFKTVDTCAGEFEALTPYHYSTYAQQDEVKASEKKRVIILGSGPNRIGQGIEFDYCCVHASFALSEAGFETIMINCNPETVSTDYDTSDRLYFEPLTLEDVLNVIDVESKSNPESLLGVIVGLGGQTPLKLVDKLPPQLVLGTSAMAINIAEDRSKWSKLCEQLSIPQPKGATVTTTQEALEVAQEIGYPILMRPSFVLGGRAMEIIYDRDGLKTAMDNLLSSNTEESAISKSRPVLIDRFLEDAIEVDVDSIRDKTGQVLIGGIMEHVEEAGVHSGDSACVIPPFSLSGEVISTIKKYTVAIADALDVQGLINIQFAVKKNGNSKEEVYVIEANPRASRTVPFVSKATGIALAKIAARVSLGSTLDELKDQGLYLDQDLGSKISVKEAVLPFSRFPELDAVLGPEMRSTGEVMGIDSNFGLAFAKSQSGAGTSLPLGGTVFFSLADRDKPTGAEVAKSFIELGFKIAATPGTRNYFESKAVGVDIVVAKLGDNQGQDVVELMKNKSIQLVINTPQGRGPRADGAHIRVAAYVNKVPCLTTLSAAKAALAGIAELIDHPRFSVSPVQELHH